jgi:hypothetical protein
MRPEFDAKDADVCGEMIVSGPAAPRPVLEPPMIPPPPWSENYVPEYDQPAPEPQPEAEAEAVEAEPLPRPTFPPPPWVRPSQADEEESTKYPPARRDEP